MGTVYMRHPRVAGSFYPKSPQELAELLERCYAEADGAKAPGDRMTAIGAVIPHAGYVYSGRVAAEAFATLRASAQFATPRNSSAPYTPAHAKA